MDRIKIGYPEGYQRCVDSDFLSPVPILFCKFWIRFHSGSGTIYIQGIRLLFESGWISESKQPVTFFQQVQNPNPVRNRLQEGKPNFWPCRTQPETEASCQMYLPRVAARIAWEWAWFTEVNKWSKLTGILPQCKLCMNLPISRMYISLICRRFTFLCNGETLDLWEL